MNSKCIKAHLYMFIHKFEYIRENGLSTSHNTHEFWCAHVLIQTCGTWRLGNMGAAMPYFVVKRKQVTYHVNLSYWCFCILFPECALLHKAKFYASPLILLRGRLDKIMVFHWRQSEMSRHIPVLLQEMPLLSLASFLPIFLGQLLRWSWNLILPEPAAAAGWVV